MKKNIRNFSLATKKRYNAELSNQYSTMICCVGDWSGSVNVPNRNGFVYVRAVTSGVVYIARSIPNQTLSANQVVRIDQPRNGSNVVNIIELLGNSIATSARIEKHASDHSWGGRDPVPVWLRQIMWWRAELGDNLDLIIYRPPFYDGANYTASTIETVDMTSHIPLTGARYVLVEIDDSGTLIYTNGTAAVSKPLLTIADIPAKSSESNWTLCTVTLQASQTAWVNTPVNTDILDLRLSDLFSRPSGGGGVATVTGDGVDNTDPLNPVISYPTPADIGAEPHDTDLTDIAGLSPSNDDIIQRKSGAWTNRTITQLWTDITALFPIETGTWSPTLTNVNNISSSSASNGFYVRVLNVVIVFGSISVTPTLTNTASLLRVSLPIASNFTSAYQAQGNGTSPGANPTIVSIGSYATDDVLNFNFTSTSTSAITVRYVAGYMLL